MRHPTPSRSVAAAELLAVALALLPGGPAHAAKEGEKAEASPKEDKAWAPSNKDAVEAFNKGVAAAHREDHRAAETAFRRSAIKDPECGVCELALAQTLLAQNRLDEAAEVLGPLQAAHPDRTEVHVQVSYTAFAAQRWDDALAAAEVVRRLDPADDTGHSLAHRVHVRHGDVAAAEQVAQEAEAAGLEGAAACLRTEADIGITGQDLDEEAWAVCKAQGPQRLSMDLAASVAHITGRFEEDTIASVDAVREGQQMGHLMRLMADRKYEEALEILEERTRAEPDNSTWRLDMAICLYNLQRHDEALAALERTRRSKDYIQVMSGGGLRGVLTDRGAQARRENTRHAYILHLALLTSQDRVEDARSLMEQVGGGFEHPPTELMGQALVLGGEGQLAEAWERLLEATGGDPAVYLAPFVASHLYDHSSTAPPKAAADLLGGDRAAESTFNQAIQQANAEDFTGCLATLLQPDFVPSHDLTVRARDLRYHCAVWGEDLAGALAVLAEEADWSVFAASTRYKHAHQYVSADDHASALNILESFTEPIEDDLALDASVRAMHVDAHRAVGELDEALAVLLQGPVDAYAATNLLWAFRSAEQFDKVLLVIEQIPTPWPADTDARIRNEKAAALLRLERVDEAIAVVESGPTEGWSRYNAAVSLAKEGLYPEARALLKERCGELPEPGPCETMLEEMP